MKSEEYAGTTPWSWCVGRDGKYDFGQVNAVDPRDAVSRALTSTGLSGRLVGEEWSVPIEILARAPGNSDRAWRLTLDGAFVGVERIVQPTPLK